MYRILVRLETGMPYLARQRYPSESVAETDKHAMEDLAASRVRCEPGYVAPTFEIVKE